MTCLFTGDVLTPETAIEHTIPRSLAGRIESREVTSSAFNNRTSALDDQFSSCYLPILSALAPALAARHRPHAWTLVSEGGDTEYQTEMGQLSLPGVRVDARNDRGRPTRWTANTRAEAEDFARRLGIDPATCTVEEAVPLLDGDVSWSREAIPAVSPAIEAIALKCFLASWDVLLAREPAMHRFTRDACTMQVRGFLRRVLFDRAPVVPDELIQYSRGLVIDHASRAWFTDTVRRAFGATNQFAHQLLVFGNQGRRAISGAWRVLDSDIWTFHLANDWHGPSFAYGCQSGVLSEQHTEVVQFEVPDWRPMLRSHSGAIGFDGNGAAETRVYVDAALGHRHRANQEAVRYIELNSDSTWQRLIENTAFLSSQLHRPASLREGAISRLERLFLRANQTRPTTVVGEVLARDDELFGPAPEVLVGAFEDLDGFRLDQNGWLRKYRRVFTAMVEREGLPGRTFSRGTEVLEAP